MRSEEGPRAPVRYAARPHVRPEVEVTVVVIARSVPTLRSSTAVHRLRAATICRALLVVDGAVPTSPGPAGAEEGDQGTRRRGAVGSRSRGSLAAAAAGAARLRPGPGASKAFGSPRPLRRPRRLPRRARSRSWNGSPGPPAPSAAPAPCLRPRRHLRRPGGHDVKASKKKKKRSVLALVFGQAGWMSSYLLFGKSMNAAFCRDRTSDL